jgi:hypothetical protein
MTLLARILLFLAALVVGCVPAPAADYLVTLTVTVTNAPSSGATLTVNSGTRTWTNSVSTPSSQVAVSTNGIGASATNLYVHLVSYPLTGPLVLGRSSSNIITLRGRLNAGITASASSGWASLSLSTNSAATNLITVRVPVAAEAEAVRKYVADQIVETISGNALTSTIAATAPALGAFMSLSTTQTVAGPKTFLGGVTASSLTATGLVNRGAAISSVGSKPGSEQFGTLASADGTNSLAVGPQTVATATDAVAVGSAAETGGARAIALGRTALAASDESVSIGSGSTVAGLRSIAVGTVADATGMDSVVFGKGASDGGYSNVVAIGTGSTGTSDWDLVLGAASHLVRIPGRLLSPILTNATLHGTISILTGGLISGSTVSNALVYATGGLLSGVTVTNSVVHATSGTLAGVTVTGGTVSNSTVRASTFSDASTVSGEWRWSMTASSSLANGVNSGVNPGSGVFFKITSGPSAAFTLAGLTGGAAGRLLAVYNATGQIMTVANESGLESTAANRIVTLTGLDYVTSGSSVIWLLYDAVAARWVVTSSATVVNGSVGGVFTPTLSAHQTWSGSNIFTGRLLAPGVGSGSTRLGNAVAADGADSISIGYASSTLVQDIGIGYAAAAAGGYSVALGPSTFADGVRAIAIGSGAQATEDRSTALGATAHAYHEDSTAIGESAQTTATDQVRLGTASHTVSVPGILQVSGGLDILSGVPANPAASTGRFYVTTSGGKLQLIMVWPDGGTNIVATQP